ncbi:hypothetical protein LCGC14_2070740 [marine sediment metagenome]|uniref:Uncharacterized protein n=1 Tax=marine sediment metagenome TaxID=412755 RepID=A0A0F9HFJ2_9ZZZZ
MVHELFYSGRSDLSVDEVEEILEDAKEAGQDITWSWREIRTSGGMRESVTVRLRRGEVYEDAYDVFSDLLTDLGGHQRREKKSKTVDLLNDAGEFLSTQYGSFTVIML